MKDEGEGGYEGRTKTERRGVREGRSIEDTRQLSVTESTSCACLSPDGGGSVREGSRPHQQHKLRMPLLRRRLLAPFHAFLFVYLPPALHGSCMAHHFNISVCSLSIRKS